MLFENWENLVRTVCVGSAAYIALVILLRISGRRTLSKMNAFDLVVTVSLGSTLATILVNRNVTLAQGLSAFSLLIGLQFVVTWTSVRWAWFRKLVTGEPMLLFYQGAYLADAMCQSRVTREEILAAIRSSGVELIDQVAAVVIETDGKFSVVTKSQQSGTSSLEGVARLDTMQH